MIHNGIIRFKTSVGGTAAGAAIAPVVLGRGEGMRGKEAPIWNGYWVVDPGELAGVQRAGMVERLRRGGITDARVLEAMRAVPRERFVPIEYIAQAYEQHPLPLGEGQTISEPQIVASMAAALQLDVDARVLEVGTGAGYAAAVLSRCAGHVITIERHGVLAARARGVLSELGYDNVEVRHGDGIRGAPDRAPFDAISVAAMAEVLPPALIAQLAPHGRLICPVGADRRGDLVLLHHGKRQVLFPVAFVPLVTDARPTLR